jgi:hypothetical protein
LYPVAVAANPDDDDDADDGDDGDVGVYYVQYMWSASFLPRDGKEQGKLRRWIYKSCHTHSLTWEERDERRRKIELIAS